MSEVRDNCRHVLDSIRNAAVQCGRDPAAVRLIAVTKTVNVEHIREAAESGISEIGENRLQEAVTKSESLRDLHLRWHFIGHLQSNKAAKALDLFDYIESVDRPDLARRLNAHAVKPTSVLVEVNLGEEKSKSGVYEEGLESLVTELSELRMLKLEGLMTVPPFSDDPERSRPYFVRLRKLGERYGLKDLSMGMSHDFEIAIAEGATMVRIGSALFGVRH